MKPNTHTVRITRSLKYNKMIEAKCSCGAYKQFDAENDYRLNGSITAARTEARYWKIDHKETAGI